MTKPAGRPVVDWGVGSYERTAGLLLPAARVLVDAAAPQEGERVLDVGCGTGNAALLAAARGAHVTAVDPSERLLGVALATAHERGIDVTCAVGEAASLPVPDAGTDCLLSNFGVIFAPDPDAAAAEMARVLRPGGRAAFTAWLPGGAVAALAATAQELVRAALSAPPAAPGFPWHDAAAVAHFFSGHGLTVSDESCEELVFTAPSPEAYLDEEFANHPMAVAALAAFEQRGVAEESRNRLLDVLIAQNEDPAAFRATSRYVVLVACRS